MMATLSRCREATKLLVAHQKVTAPVCVWVSIDFFCFIHLSSRSLCDDRNANHSDMYAVLYRVPRLTVPLFEVLSTGEVGSSDAMVGRFVTL